MPDVDPFAKYAQPISAPPSGGGDDPFAKYATGAGGATGVGGVADPEDAAWRAKVTKNENGQGLYSMKGPGGSLQVPHDWIVDAATRGYDFANDEDRTRYKNNARAGRTWDLQDIPGVGNFATNVSGRLAANMQNMGEVATGAHPLDTLLHGTDVGETMYGNPNAPVANMTGDILSLLAQDKAISGLATPSLRLKAASAAFETVEKLPPSLQKVVMAGLADTRLARATRGAVTGAPTLAAQDLLTGRGAGQAAISGATGAAVPFVAEGVGAAVSKLGEGARSILDRFKPPTVDIGSETKVPVEPGQVGEEGELTTAGTEQRKTAMAQQAAFDRDMQVGSKRAVRTSLQQVNDAIGPPARPMLPGSSGEPMPTYSLVGPQGGREEPFQFDLEGPPVAERARGELTQPAEEIPREGTTTPASYGGPFERTTEGGVTAERRVSGYMHPDEEASEYARGDVVGGGGTIGRGTLTTPRVAEDASRARIGPNLPRTTTNEVTETVGSTKNPAEAVAKRNEYRRLINSPEFSQFAPEQQARIREAHDYLTDQIGAYYAQPHGGIIPADIAAATDHIVSPGDAADSIMNPLKPGFAELNSLTGGRINALNDEIRAAKKTLWSTSASGADKASARATIAANDAQIQNEILRHAGDTPITRQYYNAMKTGYAHASFLNSLDDVIEGWSNGISRENTANSSKLKRVISADTNDFENFLKQGNNRKMLSTLMGPEAETTIKSWGQLLSNPATARRTGNTLENVVNWATYHKVKMGAIVASGLLGIAYREAIPIAAGAWGATYGARALMRRAAVSPRVTNLIRYAVENDVDPKIYSPLIARAISSLWGPQGEQPQPQKGNQ